MLFDEYISSTVIHKDDTLFTKKKKKQNLLKIIIQGTHTLIRSLINGVIY